MEGKAWIINEKNNQLRKIDINIYIVVIKSFNNFSLN
jgi:hypothetical protein